MTTEANEVGQFVPLFADNEFEINDTYPYQIRRIDNKEIKEQYQANGYYVIYLNGKIHQQRRLVAQNFIPNPDNLNEIAIAIDALEQLHIDWHTIFKTIWKAAIKYACESKICH
ncbi:MAG: hypothetical protein EZS28_000013 [Streblomastix strix]|uniref:Uncharacterized protein n=1 Tax=Streblomastix strix TaxID=222440 RepID=A0A5J4XBZ4_9EUKA|nr:MAG: hypothetical protein EZS28_000013 [Streblomastix strix]